MLQSLRLCLRCETEVLRGFTNESQLDLGCFKATGENKEAAHSGFLPLSGFDSHKKVRSRPGKLLADDAVLLCGLSEKTIRAFFYFIVLKMEELWHYNDFLGKRIICRGGQGRSTALSPIKSLCFKVAEASASVTQEKLGKKKVEAQFRHKASAKFTMLES